VVIGPQSGLRLDIGDNAPKLLWFERVAWFEVFLVRAAHPGMKSVWRGRMTTPIGENRYSGLRHHARVHSFRIFTVVLAWLCIGAAFYQKPELLTGLQRAIQRGMETVGDTIPPPWGPRIEFVFREIGGFIWLQITLIVVFLRMLLSGIAALWRLLRSRDAVP
jgi:hypothetical protein